MCAVRPRPAEAGLRGIDLGGHRLRRLAVRGWWKRLERWFWPLVLLSPFVLGGAYVASLIWGARTSAR
jgi:hypothetical protein